MANNFFWENEPENEAPKNEEPETVKDTEQQNEGVPGDIAAGEETEAPAEENKAPETAAEVNQTEAAPAEEPAAEKPAEEAPAQESTHTENAYTGKSFFEQKQPGFDSAQNEAPKAEASFWQNESRDMFQTPHVAPEEPQKKKKKHTGLIIGLAVVLAIAVAVCAVFALDYASIRVNDGEVNLYFGANASEHNRTSSGSGTKQKEVESFLDLKDTPAQSDEQSADGTLSVREIAKKNIPSVVGIVTQIQSGFQTGEGSGSGIIMTEDGYIVTNAHVIESANSIEVILDSGEKYEAKVIGSDEDSDIAVIKIEAEGLTPATFASSETAQVGDLAVAIGNPYGMTLQSTVTSGIISATNRSIQVDDNVFTLIQTDAAINSGNSGGPLINAYGEVIGINSLKLSDTYADGLGFAIPTDVFKPIVDELIQYGYISGKPSLGVYGMIITEEYTRYYGIPTGFYIQSFMAQEPMNAGLQVGDIITELDGESFTSMSELNALKNKHVAGDTVTLTVYRDENYYDNRDGSYLTITITLSDAQAINSNNSINTGNN